MGVNYYITSVDRILWDLDVMEWDFMGANRIRIHGAGNL